MSEAIPKNQDLRVSKKAAMLNNQVEGDSNPSQLRATKSAIWRGLQEDYFGF
jgi:hypothetical protein